MANLLLQPSIYSGQLIQPTTLLNTADQATYDAEKLFGIDLNKDNVQGRNIQEIISMILLILMDGQSLLMMIQLIQHTAR